MSRSVSEALYLTGGSQAFETAYFIGKIDNFFDCLNVINYTKGIHKRKPFQKPYFKPNDGRLQVQHFKCNQSFTCTYIYPASHIVLEGCFGLLETMGKKCNEEARF